MGGIFGVIDPRGVNRQEVEEALGGLTQAGTPIISDRPGAALGVFQEPDEPASIVEAEDGVTVADARLDAWLETAPAACRDAPLDRPAETFDTVLGAHGPGVSALDSLAGDFAVARYVPRPGRVTLARDAFGLRPLFFAWRPPCFAFAADPEVLIRLNMATGDLDRQSIASFLAGAAPKAGAPTAFDGISRLIGGHSLTVGRSGPGAQERWFRPEQVEEARDVDMSEHAEAVRRALSNALADRLRNRRGLLFLSGGRDSGAVAVAAAETGLPVSCATLMVEDDMGGGDRDPYKDALAGRALARQLHLPWHAAPISTSATLEQLQRLPLAARTPLAGPVFPIFLAYRDEMAAVTDSVIIDGEGGDVLFSPANIVCLDLIRRGALASALRAARGFHRYHSRTYPQLARVAIRGLIPGHLPRAVADRRARKLQRVPPWITGPDPRVPHAPPVRSARASTLEDLLLLGSDSSAEAGQIIARVTGVEYATPLLDLRVVRAALRVPSTAQAPDPKLKPVLRRALLGSHDATRRKADFTGYSLRLARSLTRDWNAVLGADMLAAEHGFVRIEQMSAIRDPRWQRHALHLAVLEAWLRYRPFGGRT